MGRINLLVGANNSGKTSVLEAVSLLLHQSDPRAMLSALRRRARWDVHTNMEWLAEPPRPARIAPDSG
ncbi:MAG: AAA family ATPase [Deltaproteobacteria bacterium]|nr:AAA family ATPase [Deltaproteobacteria bacterium]